MPRDSGNSFPSETRQLVRQERIKPDGGGPHGLVVILVALAVAGALVYALLR